jgi:chemotaxis protein histidine kinase CheA
MSSSSSVNMESPVLSVSFGKVESKLRLSKLDLENLSKKYNFEVEEALLFLKEKKSMDLSVPLPKLAYPLPFNGEKKEGYCNGIVKNHGLYTQCTKKVKGEFCKVCEEKPYGTIEDRLKVDLYEYKDPKGNSPKRYTEVLKKLKISKESVEEEAKRLNITISPIHLEEVVLENVKRGRPKTEKKVKETTGKKGRPKKEKKSVEVNSVEEEDLFATLIANVQHQPLDQPLEKVEPNEDELLDQPLEKEEAKEEAKEESTDLVAPVAVEKVEKKSKKVKEADPAKEAEKLKKAEEKAAKDAAKEIEKQKKAEEKAAKEAEKLKKAEEKAAKEAAKQKKTEEKAAKVLAPPLEKVEEEADVVRKFEHEGKSYYKSKNTGVIYNMDQEVVGKWNAERNDIDFEEEEEEEEYDD